MTKNYFGMDFYTNNKLIPVINGIKWRQERQEIFKSLIRELGNPVFEYIAPNCKKEFWTRKQYSFS